MVGNHMKIIIQVANAVIYNTSKYTMSTAF